MSKVYKYVKVDENLADKLLEERIPRRIYGLLLCDDLTITELAEKIYKDKNQRAMITKWVNKLVETKMINRSDMGFVHHKGKRYQANLFPLGNFNEEENRFVEIVLNRFINRDVRDIVDSFNKMFDSILMIQKIFKSRGQIEKYGFDSGDYKNYERNKERFWKDLEYRDNLLNKMRKGKPIKFTKRDFIFMSLIAPRTLRKSLYHSKLNNIGDPLCVSSSLME